MLKVVPIRRRNGTSGPWIMTQDHRAQAWAITLFHRGEQAKFIFARPTKAEAERLLVAAQRAAEGPIKRYSLGKRMPRS